jgi:hypothetical protein
MKVSDITTRVQRTFGDEAGVQLTAEDILRFINDGVREVLYKNESLLQKTATTNSIASQQDYAVPADVLILRGLSWKDTGETSYHKLKGLSLNEFNEYIDGWDGNDYGTGVPIVYMIFEDLITVFPTPAVSTAAALKLYYQRTPVDVALTSDTPDIPSIYHELLVKYCLQQAYEMDEDVEAVALKGKEFTEGLNFMRGRSEWTPEETYPTITVRAEDY